MKTEENSVTQNLSEQGLTEEEKAAVANEMIKKEVEDSGADEALADYPPEIPERKESGSAEDLMLKEVAEEQDKS